MNAIKFFIEGIKRFKEMGTIARSSKYIGQTMCKHANLTNAQCIVELGAGDGPITKELLDTMPPNCKLLCFEINEELLKLLRERYGHDPRVTIINDDAAKLGEYIQAAGFEKADYVFSAIPFLIIPDDTIILESKKWLKMGGKYLQLHYSPSPKKRYASIFGNASIDFVLFNIPPAFIHISEKNDELERSNPA